VRRLHNRIGTTSPFPDSTSVMLFAPRSPGPANAPLPRFVRPSIPSSVRSAPAGDRWVHEVKHDGYGLQLRIDADNVTLRTRNGHNWTDRFPGIEEAAAALPVTSNVRAPSPNYSRRYRWRVPSATSSISKATARPFFAMGLEGIISKLKHAPYRSAARGRSRRWSTLKLRERAARLPCRPRRSQRKPRLQPQLPCPYLPVAARRSPISVTVANRFAVHRSTTLWQRKSRSLGMSFSQKSRHFRLVHRDRSVTQCPGICGNANESSRCRRASVEGHAVHRLDVAANQSMACGRPQSDVPPSLHVAASAVGKRILANADRAALEILLADATITRADRRRYAVTVRCDEVISGRPR
jgi:hypothetical protein